MGGEGRIGGVVGDGSGAGRKRTDRDRLLRAGRSLSGGALHETVIGLYERHAREFERDRAHGALFERPWLERFTAGLSPGAAVLDVGGGSGEPIARHLFQGGFALTRRAAAPSMI